MQLSPGRHFLKARYESFDNCNRKTEIAGEILSMSIGIYNEQNSFHNKTNLTRI